MTRQQEWRKIGAAAIVGVAMLLAPVTATAQSQEQPPAFWDVTKRVVFDPTTYAPAIIAYDATMRDWNSSQPFFRNGFVEHNPRYTISGRPDDFALDHEAGKRRIRADALANAQMSLVNNAVDQIFERVLTEKYPTHRTLVRTLGWIERISFASYMSYRLSAAHYRQWQLNDATAARMGFK